jgi:hypothetical protein
MAQPVKPHVCRYRSLRQQLAESRHFRDLTHRDVIASFALAGQHLKVRQVPQGSQASRGERRTVPEETEPEQPVQSEETRDPRIGKGSIYGQLIGLRLSTDQRKFDLARSPRLEVWKPVE